MDNSKCKALYDHDEPQAPEERTIPSSARRSFLKIAGGSLVAAALPQLLGPMAQSPVNAAPSSLGTAFHLQLGQVQPRRLSAEGVTFEYFDFGNPYGIPVVLVHGFPDSPLAWEGRFAASGAGPWILVSTLFPGGGSSNDVKGASGGLLPGTLESLVPHLPVLERNICCCRRRLE